MFNSGVTTVTWTATDGVTASVNCSFTVTVIDNQQPVISCPVAVNADRNADAGVCTYTALLTEFDATATDNCAVTSLTYTLSGATTGTGTTLAGVVFNSGVTTVTWTATDGVTASVNCSFTVTVIDNQQPVISCPVAVNADRNADAGVCTYTALLTEFDATATDNCAVTSLTYTLSGATTGTGTTLAGVVFNSGVTTVTWTATDGVTASVNCSFTVTVIDNQQPVISCPVAVNADRNSDAGVCTYTALLNEFDATATDNCAVTSLTYTLSGATTGTGTTLAGVVFNSGVTTVTWTATDGVTASVNCSFTVTVIDNQQPVISCPVAVNADRNADAGVCTYTALLNEFDATATDNCAVTSLTYTLSGATTGTGTTLAGVVFNSGVTTVTWTATDGVTASVNCSFTVTVIDNQQPVITCPVAVNADRNANTGVCTYTAVADEFDATATDNCGIIVSLTYTLSGATTGTGTTLAGVVFNSGVTTVTWTATDGVTASVNCSFTVTVIDNQQPVISCPVAVNADRNADAGVCTYTALLTEFDATATDNCAVTSLTYTLSGATTGTGTTLAGVVFNSGVTTVTWTATDGVTASVNCSFTVTVIDNQQPVISCPVAVNADRNADAGVCTYTALLTEFDATATDNCAVTSLTYTLSGATTGTGTTLAGVVFNSGVTTVTWTATDGVTASVNCSFTVTVIDNQQPVISCPVAVNADRNADAGVCTYTALLNEFDATATDNCAVTSLTYTLSGATTGTGTTLAGVVFNSGVTTVTWTATDGVTASVNCSFTITVIDNQQPVITCPVAVNADRNANTGVCTYTAVADEFDATATDNCGIIVSLTYTLSGATTGTGTTLAGVVFNSGVTTVTWTATDGVTASVNCSFTVTVIDNQQPVIACPVAVNADRNADAGVCTYTALLTEFDATATDNCAVTSLTYTLSGATTGTGTTLAGVVFNSGVTTVTWTATDGVTASVNCSFTVTVIDNQQPVISCPVAVNADRNADAGVCTYTALLTEFDATATDNCAVTSLTYTLSGATTGTGTTLAGVVFNSGVTTVTWTATDGVTASVNCSFTVTVIDNQQPVISCPVAVNADRNADAGVCTYTALLTEFDATATDNCAVTSLTYTLSGATTGTGTTLAGVVFNSGVTTVTWTATDGVTASVNCSFTVTVIDNQQPVISCPVAVNADRNADAGVCTYTALLNEFDATATDNCAVTSLTYTLSGATTGTGTTLAGVVFNSGVTTVTWTATDGVTASVNCSFTVTVIDNQQPVISCPVAVNADRNSDAGVCTYTALLTEFDATATDNCAVTSLTYTLSGATTGTGTTLAGVVFNSGVTTVTWTATDGVTASVNCSFTVTVIDNQPPIVNTQNITIQLDATGNANITASQVNNGSTDNCGIQTMSVSPNSFTCANVGANTVTLTVTDINGNSNTGTAVVTVQDVTPPVIIGMPSNITVNVEPNTCQKLVTFTAPTATDNCGVASVVANVSTIPLGGGVQLIQLTAGIHTITYTATDINGNTSSASFTITVVDNIPPTITGCNNITVNATNGTCSAVVSYVQPIPSDNCSGVSMTINNPAYLPGNVFPVGIHTVVYTATDVAGNVTTCSFTVTVIDATPPVITCPAPVVVNNDLNQCGAIVNYPFPATATDDCPGAITITYSPLSGSFFPVGNTTVTATAQDAAGNTATCTFIVTVIDNTAPVLTCPANLTVTNDAGECGALVNFAATATDNCSVLGVITYSHAPGSMFPVGTTTVTANVMDAAGNPASCSFTITVTDNEAPVITTSGPLSANNTPGLCSAIVSVTAATAEDNCEVGSPVGTRNDGLLLTDPYPVGVTTITWNVMDIYGNPAIAATQTVTITDNQAPVITTSGLITANTDLDECGATIVVPPATATDNCAVLGVPSGTRSDGLLLSDPYPVGVTTITWNVMDIHGNPAIAATQIVSVTDNQVPVITTSGPLTANNTPGLCSAIVPITAATADDNCGVGSPIGTRSDGLLLTDPYPVGVTTITWNVMDINGNPAVAATQTVTVTDNEAPVITTSGPLTANNTPGLCSAIVSVTPATATDNCAVQGVPTGVRSDGLALTDPYPVGVTTIMWNVSDVNGNPAIVATQTVTVVDNEIPTFAVCPGNITRNNDPGVCGANVTFLIIANDNCGPTTVSQSHPSGFLFPIGTTTVTATATDGAGLTATCTFTVTVTDNELPVITTSGPINVNTDVDVCGATIAVPAATATDNCPGMSAPTGVRSDGLLLTDLYPVGITTIEWNVTDVNGNAATEVIQTITVTDNQLPVITTSGSITANVDPGTCFATVTVIPATADDNCVVGSPVGTRSDGLLLSDPYPVGVTTITWNVMDINGNPAIAAIQTVTVTDNQAPVITTSGPINVNNTPGLCGANIVVPPATAQDNCTIGSPVGTRSDGLLLTDMYPIGVTTITWNISDASGNAAIAVTQIVTVTDNQLPVITTSGPITANTDLDACSASCISGGSNGDRQLCCGRYACRHKK